MHNHKSTIASLLLVAATAVSLSSCSEEFEGLTSAQSGTSLKIETSIADTRAVITGTYFDDGSQIGLFVEDMEGNAYSPTVNCDNLTAQYRMCEDHWYMGDHLQLTETPGRVFAYYPYNANATFVNDSIDIDVTPDETGDQKDFMYGISSNEVNAANPTANITFKHALSRITLSITKGANDVGAGVISKVVLLNDSVLGRNVDMELGEPAWEFSTLSSQVSTQGRFDLKTGRFRRVENPEASIVLNQVYNLSEQNTVNIDLLVMPTLNKNEVNMELTGNKQDKGARVIITIDGADYEFNIGKDTWWPGEQYTYPVTISRATLVSVTHEYVDLGLPSGTLWARTNIGAKTELDYGDYFAWGETEPKEEYTWATYPWFYHYDVESNITYLDKYNDESCVRPGTAPDNLTTLLPEDDAATVNWGSDWCVPTGTQWGELNNSSNCTWQWVTMTKTDGTRVYGFKVKSTRNDNYIFLPAAGYRAGSSLYDAGNRGRYWISSLGSSGSSGALRQYFKSDVRNWDISASRCQGFSVRPVRVSAQN